MSFDFEQGLFHGTAPGAVLGFVDIDADGFSTGTLVDTVDNRRAMLLRAEIPATQFATDGMFYSAPYNTYERSFFQELTIHLLIMPGSQEQSGCCFSIACVFSNDLDGLPTILHFVAGDTIPPAPSPNVHIQPLPELRPNEWNTLEIPIHDVARTLDPWGRDLSLKKLLLGHLVVVEGPSAQLVDDFSIQIDGATRDSLQVLKAAFLDSLPELTPVHFVGTEIAGVPANVEHHINVYAPSGVSPIPDYDSPQYDPDRYPRNIVTAAHDLGYTVSYNHVFLPTFSRVPDDLSEDIVGRLVRKRAYGADLLEVGYQFRGRPIHDHLDAWDQLAGVDAFLTGVGVTDLHNTTPWVDVTNRFATWVDADTLSQADLLRSLNLGRACFGDPFLLGSDAYVDLFHSAGDFVMGDVVVSSLAQAPLQLEGRFSLAAMDASVVTVHSAGADTTLVELLGPAFSESTIVEISDRCHVRVELTDPVTGSILLASNPIYFRRTPPAPLCPGMRMRRVIDLN